MLSFTTSKATGGGCFRYNKNMTNALRGRVRGRMCVWDSSGLPAWVAGGVAYRFGDMVTKDKYLARVRVRKGHPTPPAFAMQTRHNFCVFRLSIQVCLQPVGGGPHPPNKKPPGQTGGLPSREPLGVI